MNDIDQARVFRLHHRGNVYHGAQFPSGRVILIDDQEQGFGTATAAVSVDELLRGGYHGARIDWPETADPGAAQRVRDLIAARRAAGPPIGTSVSRWWDSLLTDLLTALEGR